MRSRRSYSTPSRSSRRSSFSAAVGLTATKAAAGAASTRSRYSKKYSVVVGPSFEEQTTRSPDRKLIFVAR